MYIHFAFGSHGKSGNLTTQCSEFLKHILESRTLKYFPCDEFIPIPKVNSKNTVNVDLTESTIIDKSVYLKVKHNDTKNVIHYLQQPVNMICFIDTSFKALPSSSHHLEYGKLGIVLNDIFLRKNEIKPVSYYCETNLFKDPLILLHDQISKNERVIEDTDFNSIEEIIDEITAFRKPKTLTQAFLNSTALKIVFSEKETTKSLYTYDRYPKGYDFTKEKECRLVSKDNESLTFNEEDVFRIITPDRKTKFSIENFLKANWAIHPEVVLYP